MLPVKTVKEHLLDINNQLNDHNNDNEAFNIPVYPVGRGRAGITD
jgi:hypothetical protein